MAGEIETWGTGFDKIQRACSRYGTPLPRIKATKGNVTIYIEPAESYLKLLNRESASAKSAEKSAESAEKSADYPKDMKPKHRQILDAMKTNEEYSAEKIGELVSLKGSRTRQILKELVSFGYVEAIGGTKGRRYKKK